MITGRWREEGSPFVKKLSFHPGRQRSDQVVLFHRVVEVFLQIIHLWVVKHFCITSCNTALKSVEASKQICAHFIIDLGELDKDREGQAEEQVANHCPAATIIF